MKYKYLILIFVLSLMGFGLFFILYNFNAQPKQTNNDNKKSQDDSSVVESESSKLHPMAINSLRNNEYPGGDFVIEEELVNGLNYKQYIASYKSEGLKIYGLLTVPLSERPETD